MSKRRASVVAATLTVLTLLGCGLGSAGGDGDLADDWRALPQAESFTPGKGCHAKALAKNASREDAATVDCTGTHLSETIFVGRLTGAVAELPDVPLAANAALVPAYTECHNRADALLGTWLDFRLSLRMVLPTAEG
ncbi:MAG: hypothetical protein HOV79_27910 [Hamadaea sp.]|nr:hypothetical protein [Hamadaea sp.]